MQSRLEIDFSLPRELLLKMPNQCALKTGPNYCGDIKIGDMLTANGIRRVIPADWLTVERRLQWL
jgi:hypothetical protein